MEPRFCYDRVSKIYLGQCDFLVYCIFIKAPQLTLIGDCGDSCATFFQLTLKLLLYYSITILMVLSDVEYNKVC